MNARPYLMLSGTLFGVVGLVHLVRIVQHWPFVLGPYQVPMWISAVAAVGGFTLGLWGWVQAARRTGRE